MFTRIRHIYKTVEANPRYALMRSLARFMTMRDAVAATRGVVQRARLDDYIKNCQHRKSETVFSGVDPAVFAQEMQKNGIAFGLRLPESDIKEICQFADTKPCYADREPSKGFLLANKDAMERYLGKPLLLAQYYNTTKNCPAIARLVEDPVLKEIAARYLGSVPTFVGANLWWTFPVKAREEDRVKHAHLYHRDIDDFRFFKFFFYFTDVEKDDGAHMCVATSHRKPPNIKPGDQWKIRRYQDGEVEAYYPKDKILEITGKAGDGFAEDTTCMHKARTPERAPRLVMTLTYGLYDYGAMHDNYDPSALKMAA